MGDKSPKNKEKRKKKQTEKKKGIQPAVPTVTSVTKKTG
jgi:hypothetical protein